MLFIFYTFSLALSVGHCETTFISARKKQSNVSSSVPRLDQSSSNTSEIINPIPGSRNVPSVSHSDLTTPMTSIIIETVTVPTTSSFVGNEAIANTSVSPPAELVQAIYNYKAAHSDELTFQEGEIIRVLGRDEPEWWRGRIESSRQVGLFPCNYVKPYSGTKPSNTSTSSSTCELNEATH
ncbi:unnamed protein product [Protopolystoma xenopodis]|uniref:SH3 domain-containing protein n=1 Tax=Protopolystoma xenopodis TaxID=117903 RepID=A0A3S5A4K5_9PLAT|nr:unnamed protein product [Protopolystoma xenopodis]